MLWHVVTEPLPEFQVAGELAPSSLTWRSWFLSKWHQSHTLLPNPLFCLLPRIQEPCCRGVLWSLPHSQKGLRRDPHFARGPWLTFFRPCPLLPHCLSLAVEPELTPEPLLHFPCLSMAPITLVINPLLLDDLPVYFLRPFNIPSDKVKSSSLSHAY